MRKAARCMTFIATVLLISRAAVAAEYYGYLTVNDEDYGYWEGQPMLIVGGERLALEAVNGPIAEPLAFELSHDVVQGLVRQFVLRPSSSRMEASSTVSDAAGAAGSQASSAEPVAEGSWVPFGKFQTFGFGQYEGSDPTYGVYCDRNPSVWVWLAADSIEGLSPDDAADRVLGDENGMARLMLGCEAAMEVSR